MEEHRAAVRGGVGVLDGLHHCLLQQTLGLREEHRASGWGGCIITRLVDCYFHTPPHLV